MKTTKPKPRYQLLMWQIEKIASEFKHGASMTRLSHKHSLPLQHIEFIIRAKLLAQKP